MLRRRPTEWAHRLVRQLRVLEAERHLRRSDVETARAVTGALRAARRNRFDETSRAWFDRIEALRRELAASDAIIEVVDYGAGLPSMSRSEDQMRSGSVSRSKIARLSVNASLPESQGRLLHAIVNAVAPTRAIELGSCVGLSAAYQASALAADGSAAFVTCEGAPALAATAATNLQALGLHWARVEPGRFDDTVPSVAHDLAPLGYAFIDGHHDEAATLRYFDMIRPHASPGAVFVFDDIRWSDGMARAWSKISSSRPVAVAADLGRLGLVVLDRPPHR